MKIKITFVLILVYISTLSFGVKSDWVELYNGKNLKGWEILNGTAPFEAKGEVVVGTSKKGTPNTFLATKKEYKNFVLEYDMKMETGLNSGVQIRSHSFEDYNNGRVHGTQIECEDSKRGWAGGVYYEAKKGWRYPLEYNPKAKTAFKKEEWNHFKVVCFEHHIMTWVNGIACANLLEEEAETGFIALQVHGIGNSNAKDGKTIQWKNIRIKESTEKDLEGNDAPQVSYLVNELTSSQKAEGWKLLWDGKTTNGWRGAKLNKFPEGGWKIKDNMLVVEKSDGGESTNGGDIVSEKKYTNFVLELDFNLSKGTNSGLKYLVDTELNQGEGSSIGCEFQILDDKVHPDAKKGVNGNRTLGSLYDLIRANGKEFNPYLPGEKYFNGIDKWNRARVEVRGNKVAHYLNGCKVIEYERGTQMWRALVAYSKYSKWPNFGELKSGNILLQDHGDEVRFRSIKIKELE